VVDEPARPARCRVAIVAAGLAAATALCRRGIEDVVVLEREGEPGGVPRLCGHPVFGLREFGRVLSGPAYARRLAGAACTAGVENRTQVNMLRLDHGGNLEIAAPLGRRGSQPSAPFSPLAFAKCRAARASSPASAPGASSQPARCRLSSIWTSCGPFGIR
jgi:NADPH-dependent 2,4-dienoyl-CoA reductase/sulfur reductase-like enzyme